jgi:hypothetical protein
MSPGFDNLGYNRILQAGEIDAFGIGLTIYIWRECAQAVI